MIIGGGRRFGMGAKPQGVWWTGVPQKLKNF